MDGVSSSPGREVHSLLAWAALGETKVTDHQFDTDLPTSKGKIRQCLDPYQPHDSECGLFWDQYTLAGSSTGTSTFPVYIGLSPE